MNRDGIFQRGFADGHRAGERMQDADFNGVVRRFRRRKCGQAEKKSGGGRQPTTAAHGRRYIVSGKSKHEV